MVPVKATRWLTRLDEASSPICSGPLQMFGPVTGLRQPTLVQTTRQGSTCFEQLALFLEQKGRLLTAADLMLNNISQ